MTTITTILALLSSASRIEGLPSKLQKRLDNGLALKPPMGWNSYNVYNCQPNQSVIRSNAQAVVDLGLADLGYHYVTTDCGWTLPERTENGTLTWNPELFPDGFPALGEFIHSLGLGFGVYSDVGVQMCMTGQPNQTGSLYHEQTDANTFSGWGADLAKIDNCYSSIERGFPNVDYEPLTSPRYRFETMRDALNATGRDIVHQVCEWGLDFPSAWAPELGNTWRLTNDIIPEWRTIYRIMNQFVPSASYAGPGHWGDLDMMEIGNKIFTEAEEQTHFSLWTIAKTPLSIGCALNDTFTSVSESSLAILKNEHAISYNQDSLGVAANLTRRYTDEGLDVWSGLLSGGRTVIAVTNWNNHSVTATLNLPDVGLQGAGSLYDVWKNETTYDVVTSHSSKLTAHGTMLVELSDTTPAGRYTAEQCGHQYAGVMTFSNVYGLTTSDQYVMTIKLAHSKRPHGGHMVVSTSASEDPVRATMDPNGHTAQVTVSLSASNANTVTIQGGAAIASIEIEPPQGTFYPSTAFAVSGTARHITCVPGHCLPVESKIGNITADSTSTLSIARSESSVTGPRYVEMIYINNDVAKDSAWTNGTNSRNITVAVNGRRTTRLDVPLSGRSSELYSPMKGWGDAATLGVLVEGWGMGGNAQSDEIVVGNEGGDAGVQPFGADFVGMRVF